MKSTNLKFEDLVKGQFYKATGSYSYAYVFQYDGSSLDGSGTKYLPVNGSSKEYQRELSILEKSGSLNINSNCALKTYLEATDEEIEALLSRLPKEEVLPYVKKILYETY